MTLILHHIAGKREGETDEFEFEAGASIVLGRLPECEVAFDPDEDRAASGKHARIINDRDEVFIEDLQSSNGTLVNGKRVESRVLLRNQDVIEVGVDGPKLAVEMPDAADSTLAMEIPRTIVTKAVPAEPSEGRQEVGAQTVALMINKATRSTSRKFTLLVGGLAVLLILAVVAIVTIAIRSEQRAEDQEDQLREAEDKLEETREELDKTRTDLEAELETERNKQNAQNLTARLRRTETVRQQIAAARVEVTEELRQEFEARQEELVKSLTEVETSLSENYGQSLYMLGFSPDAEVLTARGHSPEVDREGFDEGFCTAFAVTADGWLATNAHCIDALWEVRYDLGRVGVDVRFFAKRNGESGLSYPLKLETAVTHPGFSHAASPDVGLVQLDLQAIGKTRVDGYVWVASRETTLDLAVGQPVYTMGFPGKVMDPYRVSASFRGGNIARLTNYDSKSADAAGSQWVWHTALISKGTSGSPMFDRYGRVVAINNGTMSAETIVTSDGDTEEVRTIYSADGLNFGIRADLLHDLAVTQGVVLPVPPKDIVPLVDVPGGDPSP